MLHYLLPAALLSFSEAPAEVPLPQELASQELRAVLQANDTWFAVSNYSDCEQLLFVNSSETGFITAVRVAPGIQLLWPFPQGSASDIFVELLSLDVDGWRNSGAISITELASLEQGTTWLTLETTTIDMWSSESQNTEIIEPTGEILPEPVLQAGAATLVDYSEDENLAPTHVPIVVPGEGGIPPSEPPPITKKPLPPV